MEWISSRNAVRIVLFHRRIRQVVIVELESGTFRGFAAFRCIFCRGMPIDCAFNIFMPKSLFSRC